MYKNSFLCTCKKTIHPIFTKINRVRQTVTCNTRAKFLLNRMHHLDAFVFTHTTYIHTHRISSMNEFKRPQNIKIYDNLKIEIFRDFNTFLALYVFGKQKEGS